MRFNRGYCDEIIRAFRNERFAWDRCGWRGDARGSTHAPIHLFVDSFNKGDLKAAATAFSPAGLAIIDDVSPHVWVGPNAVETWNKALAAGDQTEGDTDGAVTIGKPTRQVVSGDRGYVVLPAVYTFKEKGVAMREVAQMVYALQKGTSGWQITGWTWVGTTPKPAAGAAKSREPAG